MHALFLGMLRYAYINVLPEFQDVDDDNVTKAMYFSGHEEID